MLLEVVNFLNFVLTKQMWDYGIVWDFFYRSRYISGWVIRAVGRIYLTSMLASILLVSFNFLINCVMEKRVRGDTVGNVVLIMKLLVYGALAYIILLFPLVLFAYNQLERDIEQFIFIFLVITYLVVGVFILYLKSRKQPVIKAGF